MLLKTRIALAAGVALALSSVVPLTLAQVPRAPTPTQGQAEAKEGTEKTDARPDPRTDPKAAQLSLRQRLGLSGGGRGGRGGGFGGASNGLKGMVLTSTALQEELNLTDRQVAALKETSTTLDKQRRELFSQMRGNGGGRGGRGGGGPGGGGGQFDRQAFGAAMANMAQMSQSATDRVLTAPQKRRLAEIELQIAGPLSIAENPAVASKLNLSPSQQQKILAIAASLKAGQDQLRASVFGNRGGPGGPGGFGAPGGFGGPGAAAGVGGPGRTATRPTTKAGTVASKGTSKADTTKAQPPTFDREAMRTRMREMGDETNRLHDEAEVKIAKVLTDRQKRVYTKLLGEPYNLTLLTQGGGRGGRGGGGQDNGGQDNGSRRGGQPADAGSGGSGRTASPR